MRLLLLLSAVLTALSGIAGTRVAAQPVQTSAAAAVAVPLVAAVVPATARPAFLVFTATPPLRLAARPLVSAVVARILYAERRRE